MTEQRIGIADLEKRLRVHRSTIGVWYRTKRFPRPHYIGKRRKWFLAEIEAWEAVHVRGEPRSGGLFGRAAVPAA